MQTVHRQYQSVEEATYECNGRQNHQFVGRGEGVPAAGAGSRPGLGQVHGGVQEGLRRIHGRPRGFLGAARRGVGHLGQEMGQGARVRPNRARGEMVSRWQTQRVGQLSGSAPDRRPAQQGGHHLAGRAGRGCARLHLPDAPRRGLPVCQCAQEEGRQEGRPGGHLPADDPRTGHLAVGLRPPRCGPFGCLRRFFRHRPAEPHRGLSRQGAHHRGRGTPCRQADPAQAQCRRGHADLPERGDLRCGPPRRQRGRNARGPRLLVAPRGQCQGY